MALTLIIWMNGDSMLSTLVEMKTHTHTDECAGGYRDTPVCKESQVRLCQQNR